jgi:hypothetical protein
MEQRYTVTITDPRFPDPYVERMNDDDLYSFVRFEGQNEDPHAPWRWVVQNEHGFVVAAFDNLRMYGKGDS